jgi:hypothetical protein
MKRLILSTLMASLLFADLCWAEKDTDEQVAARSDVIDLASAFQNDGFKIRDGNYFGKVSKDRSPVVAVNLYNGDAYWFTVASASKTARLKIFLFDETGKPVRFENYQAGNRAAAGYSPETSGLYYVQVLSEDGQPATFCLIYTFK